MFLLLTVSVVSVTAFQSREELVNAIVNPANPIYIKENGRGLFDYMDQATTDKKQTVPLVNGTTGAGKEILVLKSRFLAKKANRVGNIMLSKCI